MSKTLLSVAVAALAGTAFSAYCPKPSLPFDCPSTAVGCTNNTVTGKPYDSCCVATDGLVVLSMNWTMGWLQNPNRTSWFNLEKVMEQPKEEWTIHGLWPDHCDGTYSNDERGCDYPKRYYEDVEKRIVDVAPKELVADMRKYWPSGDGDYNWFWSHEFTKHGTCYSVLDPACYGSSYKKTATSSTISSLPCLSGLVTPSTKSLRQPRSEFYAALKKATGHEAGLQCARNLRADDKDVKYFVSEIYIYLKSRPRLGLDGVDPFVGHFQSCPDNVPLYYLPFPEKKSV
ncbi:ribonuclease T2-like protein [Chytridium lagenaria]|nr:ribonuclease T2-like protein [Chytridium lagenaria]